MRKFTSRAVTDACETIVLLAWLAIPALMAIVVCAVIVIVVNVIASVLP